VYTGREKICWKSTFAVKFGHVSRWSDFHFLKLLIKHHKPRDWSHRIPSVVAKVTAICFVSVHMACRCTQIASSFDSPVHSTCLSFCLVHFHRTWRSFSSSSPLMLPPELLLAIVRSNCQQLPSPAPVPRLPPNFSSTSSPPPSLCSHVVRVRSSVVPCLRALLHKHPAYVAARANFMKRASTRALKGPRTFQSAKDDGKAVRALSHLLAYLPVTVADYRLPLLATVHPKHNNAITTTLPLTHIHSSSTPERTTTPSPEAVSAASLISPPPTPQHKGSSDAAMNRAPLHGAPTWGSAPSRGGPARGSQPVYGSQDARGSPQPAFGNQSNFAVQPAANSGNFRLKKAAVKIVGAASSMPPRATPAASPSPVPGPVKAKPKEPERYVL
jgi:hypothetical protein